MNLYYQLYVNFQSFSLTYYSVFSEINYIFNNESLQIKKIKYFTCIKHLSRFEK